MFLAYDVVSRVPAHIFQGEHRFSPTIMADWNQFCRQTMLGYLDGCSERIDDPNKSFEIEESKFGRRKYHRGHLAKGQWVFGGAERHSGKTFPVPLPDRSAGTLMAVVEAWIEPGTTVISDCWTAYRDLGEYRKLREYIQLKK
jgi:hypothetical protein